MGREGEIHKKPSVPPSLICPVPVVPILTRGNNKECKTVLAITKSRSYWGGRINGRRHAVQDGGKGGGRNASEHVTMGKASNT